MKRIGIFIVVLALAFPVLSYCESLAELAKKEKARREKLEQEGKKGKVYTNQDIKNIKSSLGIVVSGPIPENPPPEAPAEDDSSSNAEIQNRETQQKIKFLKDEREVLKEEIAEARGNVDAGGLAHSTNVGGQYRNIREAEERIKEIDRELEELEKQESE